MTSSATAVRTESAVCCPSCQSQAQGNFCATCGETLHHHLPSAGEFAHEFISHYVALEGKLLQTLKLLLFRPGRLTLDFLRGRRVPTIPPLRLYLTLSLIMFAMIKWYGVQLPRVTLERAIAMAAHQDVLQLVSAWDYLQLLPFVWLLAYLPLAMRRVYGGTRIATAWKWAVLLTVHVLVIATCSILAELIGVVTHG